MFAFDKLLTVKSPKEGPTLELWNTDLSALFSFKTTGLFRENKKASGSDLYPPIVDHFISNISWLFENSCLV